MRVHACEGNGVRTATPAKHTEEAPVETHCAACPQVRRDTTVDQGTETNPEGLAAAFTKGWSQARLAEDFRR